MLDIWQSESQRSDVQMMAEILRVTRWRDVGDTEISYSVNMNYLQLLSHINRLLRLKLLDSKVQENSQVSYQITEKGEILLSQLESIQELLPGIKI